MTANSIIQVPILPFGMVNCHIIKGDSGCVLVDAGTPGSEGRIAKALREQGLSFGDIRLIVITHAHMDHAGSAAALRRATGAPIVAHEGDLPHYRREARMTFCPTGWAGRYLLRRGIILRPYEGFQPDMLLRSGETLDLRPYGVEGHVLPTLGHTAGSVSIELASREALVGDLVSSGVLMGGLIRTGRAIRPPFEEAPRTVGEALQRLLDSGVTRFYLGHGDPLGAEEVQRHAQALMRLGTLQSALA